MWPELSQDDLAKDQEEILRDPDRNSVIVASTAGTIVGFVEVSLRDWAEGCSTRPVGYIEAWYVEPEQRRSKIGRRLIEAAERWAASRGCVEMGSDAELPNEVSQAAHRAVGYSEVLRSVSFARKLKP